MWETMNFSQAYDFSAPPEVVFNSLVDADRTTRWLPRGVTLETRDADRMVVRAGGQRLELRISTDMPAMRMTGSLAGHDDLHGDLEVRQSPAGGSSLLVEIEGLDSARVRPLVDDAIHQL